METCLTSKLTSLGQVSSLVANFLLLVGTAYEGGIFRCKLVVDAEFPQKPPKGKFAGFLQPFRE